VICWEFKQELANQVILDILVNPKANIFGQRVGGNDGENKTNVDNSLTFHVFFKLFPREERHIILAMMLEPNFKSIHLISGYVGRQEGNNFGR
jgi:hypothetical protein